jgi:hypothetical protein
MKSIRAEEMKPEDYMCPDLFKSEFDDLSPSTYADDQYAQGLQVGRNAYEISIACNGTWGSVNKDGSTTRSYEKIGYHGRTCDLLQGFLDSGTPIRVYRYNEFNSHNTPDGVVINDPDALPESVEDKATAWMLTKG